jgi:hypothetical protein
MVIVIMNIMIVMMVHIVVHHIFVMVAFMHHDRPVMVRAHNAARQTQKRQSADGNQNASNAAHHDLSS